MAVYREKRRTRPIVWLGIAAGVLVLLGVVVALTGFGQLAPAGATPRARAQTGLRDVADSLDLFSIEYPKVAAGQPSGAGPALVRARSSFNRVRPDLAAVDPTAAARFDAALQGIEQQAAAHAPAPPVVAAATQLHAELQAWISGS